MLSAKEMRQRPTAALTEADDPYTKWTSHDYRLSEALYTLEQNKCSRCGNASWYCRSSHNGIDFELNVGVCYAEAEIKDREKEFDLGPGEWVYATAVGIENEDKTREPLPSRAEALAKI